MIWACGRLAVGGVELLRIARESVIAKKAGDVREAAVFAIEDIPLDTEQLSALESLAVNAEPGVRTAAAAVLAKRSPQRIPALLPGVSNDAPALIFLLAQMGSD